MDKAVVNLTTEKMSVDYAGDKVSPEAIEKAVADAGYEVEVYNPDTAKSQEEREEDKIHKVRERLIWSSIFTVPLFYLAMGQLVGLPVPNFLSPHHAALTYALVLLVLTVPVMWLGRSFYSNGFRTLAKGHPNMDALVAWQLRRPSFIVFMVLTTFLWGMPITPTNFISSRWLLS